MKFWKDKKVFLTGHTGFKGSWMSILLEMFGAHVTGYSLKPNTIPNLFEKADIAKSMNSVIGDILDYEKLLNSVLESDPEILIHMAAQPLVRFSYDNPKETYLTNVIGTLNVLEAARKCKSLKSVIIITSDKCYENINKNTGYKESDPMGGYDPYSSSKGCCELLVSSYIRSYFNLKNTPNVASVRAGNVIGGGDWSNDRLVPDIIKSFKNNQKVIIRNPNAIRPWQHVIEPLYGYLLLAKKLYNDDNFSGGWNFGPQEENCLSVQELIEKSTLLWGGKASWSKDTSVNPYEASILKLDSSKSRKYLDWAGKWDTNIVLSKIIKWHKLFLNGKSAKSLCVSDINEYLKS